MSNTRKATMIAGILYLFGTIAGILSVSQAIDGPEFLVKAFFYKNQVISGALFQFLMTVSYAGFAICLYPIIRKYSESLAVGFVSFRFVAASLNIFGVVIMLLILALSQNFVEAITPDLAYYQTLGELLRHARDLINHVAMILSYTLAGIMLYFIFYQTKLIPRWLTLWGFVGISSTVLATMLVLFGLINIITPAYIIMSMPLALQELVLAMRLIFKGFNPSVLDQNKEQEVFVYEGAQ
ncbi:MAG: DUF4386 domain-containing protein [Clostridiales bacterium]|nr:DUF4386 domain-containing protein [Clostridiales bacterium]